MAPKIHPNLSITLHPDNSSSEREVFTLWMKSLVFSGNGCTVYSSSGEVVFLVDNYQKRCCSEVFLMDSAGNVLFTIRRKRSLQIFGWSEEFRLIDSDKEKPLFRVRRDRATPDKDLSCIVTQESSDDTISSCCLKIKGLKGKSTLKIIDFSGNILAEAREKQSSSGIPLGEDVMTLMVEPHMDQSLTMALVVVYSLINNKM